MKKEVFLILFIFIISSVGAQLADSPWPMFHGGVQHGGLSEYDTSHVDGTIKWKFDTGGSIESSPVIAPDGTIYIGNHNNDMYAINPDGTLKWKFDAGESVESEGYPGSWKGILSTPAIAKDGTVYFTSMSNYLFALNPDGTLKWKFPVKRSANIWSSPAIDTDGTIYIGSYIYEKEPYVQVGYVFAVNPDGTEKWRFETTHVHLSTAIGQDGTLYVGGATSLSGEGPAGQLNALTKNGNLLWSYTFEEWQESSPSIAEDGIIYIGSKEGKVYAINPDGILEWSYEAKDLLKIDEIIYSREHVDEMHLNGISALPAIGKDGTIYVGAWNSYFYALNPDGTLKWKFETPAAFEGVSSSAAIGADGTIYVGSNSGYFYALNPDGTEKWKFKGPSFGAILNSPAIGSDGTVYVGVDTHLYAFSSEEEGMVEEPEELIEPPKSKDEIIYQPVEWNPSKEGVDCLNLKSEEYREKCDMFCYDNPEECPDYFERKRGDKRSFFQKIINWFKRLFE